MKLPTFDRDQIWWHCGRLPHNKPIQGAQHPNGGLHLGTFLQAKDRFGCGRGYFTFRISPSARLAKQRDHGTEWSGIARTCAQKGIDVLYYFNRYEGLANTRISDKFRSHEIDAMSNTRFLRHAPTATWSLLVLNPDVLMPLCDMEHARVYKHERAALRREKCARQSAHIKALKEQAKWLEKTYGIPQSFAA